MKKSSYRKAQKYLSLLPRWAYYLVSLFIGGPVGPVVVFLAFHVLDRASDVLGEDDDVGTETYSRSETYTRRAEPGSPGNVVFGEDYTVRDEGTEPERSTASTSSSWNRTSSSREEEMDIPSFDSSDVRVIISEGERAMEMIHRANDRIPDPALTATIDSIENSCRQILEIIRQKEDILPQMRTFLRYYLPTTLKLLNARAKLDRSAYTPKAREVRNRISKALGEVDLAFRKQVESLDEYRFVDLESEIDVLTDMLKADGLLDEDNAENRQTQGVH